MNDEMDYIVRNEPEKGIQIILNIVDKSTSFPMLYFLAAGALEDILVYNGERVIEVIEKQAKQSKKLRITLGGVWQRDKMGEKIWQKIQAIALPEGTKYDFQNNK